MRVTGAPVAQGPAWGPHTSTAAVLSLLFGVAAWVFLPFAGAIVAVVCGHLARSTIRASGGMVQGDALALAGLVLGWLQLLLVGLVVLLVVAIVVYGVAHGGDWFGPLHENLPGRGELVRAVVGRHAWPT